jgi:diguanylate cyclase (GGDEF)-like protein
MRRSDLNLLQMPDLAKSVCTIGGSPNLRGMLAPTDKRNGLALGIVTVSTGNTKFDPHELTTECIRHVYRRRAEALVLNALGMALVCVVLWPTVGHPILAWGAFMAVGHVCHWRMGQKLASAPKGSGLSIQLGPHALAAGLAGLGWGSLGATLPVLPSPMHPLVLVFICMAPVLAVSRLAAVPRIQGAYALGALLPLLVVAAWLPQEERLMVLLLPLLVGLVLWRAARVVEDDLVTVVLRRLSLERMAWEDKLTGLANRRRFDQVLEDEWRRATRAGLPLSLLLIDVDHFKLYNDHYGHTSGDECLRRVGQALGATVHRAGDLAARYGGEEFVLLLPNTSLAEAKAVAERVIQNVRSASMVHARSSHGVITVSVGGATVNPVAAMALGQAVERADEALYRAKAQGRNRAEWAPLSA